MAVLLIGTCLISYAQTPVQITHTDGELDINGITVAVSSDGTVDVNTGYCINTSPYFIGYNYALNESGTGSYTFNFSPPVTKVMLHFSGISHSSIDIVHLEEIQLYLNGSHYAIPEPGEWNECDDMAILTDEGNIRACLECAVSGWMGTTIEGSISTLRVLDTLYSGMPAGTIFSLFIFDSIANGLNGPTANREYLITPNPVTEKAVLTLSPNMGPVTFMLYTSNGDCVRTAGNITSGEWTLWREGLPAGLYFYTIQQENGSIRTGKLLFQ